MFGHWRLFGRFLLVVAVLLGTTIVLHQAVISTNTPRQEDTNGIIDQGRRRKPEIPKPTPFIPEECGCKDPDTGEVHDFCYSLSRNVFGKRFDCSWLRLAKDLGLLDHEEQIFNFREEENLVEPVFATGSSEGHFRENLRAISTLQEMFPTQKMLFFDLGLNEKSALIVQGICNVEYRKFRFQKYPGYVRSLMQYRWKPLIIAEVLKEHGSVWWFDSSVVWRKSNLSHIYELVNCNFPRKRMLSPPPTLSTPNPRWVASGWHKDQWRMSVWRCDKFPYMLQGFTGHGIFPATHSGVFEYIPSDMQFLKQGIIRKLRQHLKHHLSKFSPKKEVKAGFCSLHKDPALSAGHLCSEQKPAFTSAKTRTDDVSNTDVIYE